MDILKPKAEWEISHNAKIKAYPNYYIISVCNSNCYREAGVELRGDDPPAPRPKGKCCGRSKAESLRRARAKIKDIAICTPFTHFVTLTLDKEKIDRYNYNEIIKKMRGFLSNAVERKGFTYLLVPEFHKDGAVHFHGLYKADKPMGEADSGKRTKAGQVIYNLTSWGFGFSTSIPLVGEYDKVVSYILKYVSKDSQKVGGRWYLSGGSLRRPEETLVDIDFSSIGGDVFEVPDTNLKFKYLKVDISRP